ncbi:MAG: HAD family phosphatase [Bryobacterales bacterium]|nr:HAD family phosphatase [Bryobacterales bacterium]
MHSQPEAILFDFDGVLADTEPLHWQCWGEVIRPLGMSISWQNYQDHCIGISDRDFLETLGRVSHPPRAIDELWPLYPLKKKMLAERACTGNLVSAEMKALLLELSAYQLAVVTSSATLEIQAILQAENILDLFGTCVYGDQVRNLKPNPEPYLTAMERLGVTRAIVLEDSGPGIQSGKAAGCEVLEVRHPSEVPGMLRARLALA